MNRDSSPRSWHNCATSIADHIAIEDHEIFPVAAAALFRDRPYRHRFGDGSPPRIDGFHQVIHGNRTR